LADNQVHAAVAVGVEQLHVRVGQREAGRGVAHGPGQVEAPLTQVAPVPDRGAVHLQDVRQAVAEEVGQLQVGASQRRGRQVSAVDREEVAPFGREARVAEFQWRQRLALPVVIVAGHPHLAEK